jgi:molybdate transport system substrate-binding protein
MMRAGTVAKTVALFVLGGPVSEIVMVPGFEFVGPVPQEIQHVTTFSAAVVTTSKQLDAGKRRIAFLASQSRDAAKRLGMQPFD